MYWSGVFCSVCAGCADDSSASSCACLGQGCRCGDFFPNSAVFALVLGKFVLAYGILALPLLFLGYAYGVAFFRSICLSSAYLYPAVAGLVDFCCGPPSLVVPVCVWGSFWGGGAVSSFSPPAWRGVGYCWASSGVASVPLPGAPAVARGMSGRRLPLGVPHPFWLQLPVLLLRWSLVVGWRCLLLPWWHRLGDNPSLMLSVLLLRRLACRGSLGSAPCVRELPLELCLLSGRQCNIPACFPLP